MVQALGQPLGSAQADETRHVWFVASMEIRNREPDAVEAALLLKGELWGGDGESGLDWSARAQQSDVERLVDALDDAVAGGLVCFERVEWAKPPSPDTEEPVEPPPVEEAPPLDFIEVVLVDEDGQPVGNVAYELKLPDGQVVAGRTDFKGKCWTPRTPSGSCELTFPELDQAVWAAG